jgi:hypothetical protein
MKITIKPNSIRVNKADATYPELLQMLCSAVYHYMCAARTIAPEKIRQAMEDEVYNMTNTAFSNVLEAYVPTREQHPDFTVEAMRYAEDLLLEHEFEEIPEEELPLRQKRIEKFLEERLNEVKAKLKKE